MDINRGKPADEQLQLLVVKDLDEVERYEIVESLKEGEDLHVDALVQPVAKNELAVLELVLIRHVDVCSTRLQLDVLVHVEELARERECLAQDLRVVLQGVKQTIEELRVKVLEIIEHEGVAQHHFVERFDEVAVQQLALAESLADDSAYESEHFEKLLLLMHPGRVRVRVVGGALVRRLEEEGVVWIKYALADQLEPLFGEAPFVHTLFVVELDREFLLP